MDHRTEKVQPGHALASQIPHQIPHRLHDPGGAPAKVLNGSVNSIYITFLRELKHPSPPNHCQWCGCYPLTWCTSNFGPKWLATIKDPVSKCKRSSPKRIWFILVLGRVNKHKKFMDWIGSTDRRADWTPFFLCSRWEWPDLWVQPRA